MSVLLRRYLSGDHMEMQDKSPPDANLPPGVWHSISCKGYREASYENWWMVPFCFIMCILAPYAWLLRLDGIREGNTEKRKKGYRYLFMLVFICLIFLVFENDVNHSPKYQAPFSNKIIFGIYIVLQPAYIILRDNDLLCGSNSKACCCRQRNTDLLCFAMGEFWDYGMMAISSVAVPFAGLWSSIACHDVKIELGHWVPFLGFLAYGGILLYFAGSRKQGLTLQYAEGWCWVAWGVVFNVYFIPGSGGGLFYSLFHGGNYSHRWDVNQQHIFQAIFYIFVGLMGIVFARMGIRTGFHILLLGSGMFTMLQVHEEYCLLARTLHQATGMLFFVAGMLRYFERILECSLVMIVVGGCFVCSAGCIVTWGDANFELVSFVTFVIMCWSSWWIYVAFLFQGHWNAPISAEEIFGQNGEPVIISNSRGNTCHDRDSRTKYSEVNPAEDGDPLSLLQEH